MALRKQIIEMPAMDGLQQKTVAQRLQPGKSAKAINLQKNKQGRLEKRLGLIPLKKTDPYGSGYSTSTGLQLGAWNGGSQDTLVILGRGDRPGTTATATSIQTYSDDLSGPLLKGPAPELSIASDTTVAGSPGGVTSPMCAVNGDFMMTAWIEAGSIPSVPQPVNGQLAWMVTQISTGQIVVGPNLVDTTSATGTNIQYARLDVVGTTFVIAYGRYNSPQDTNIYVRTLSLSSLTSGGTWSPSPGNAPTVLVSDNVSANTAFDIRAADASNFVLAYEGGTFNLIGGGVTANILVKVFPVNTLVASATWAVQSANLQATAFGVRTNTTSNNVVICYSLPSEGYSYQIFSAVATYPGLVQENTPTIIYTPTARAETPPVFLDVALCPGSADGHENYVESHSPAGAVWNACTLPATAAQTGGAGATATCNIKGSVASVTLTSGGVYQDTRSGGNSVTLAVTDAQQNLGITWELSGLSYPGPQIYDNANSTQILSNIDQPATFSPTTGTAASLTFSSSTNIVTVTGMSGLATSQVGFPITISNSSAGNNGTFVIATVVSSTSCTYYNAAGATDSSGAVHWSVPNGYTGDPNLIYPLTATFSGGVGVVKQATATATINGGIYATSLKITNPGAGYTGTPSITFTSVDGNGSGAAAIAVMSNGQFVGWVVTSPGSGYTQPPTITISYPSNTTATMTESTQCRLFGLTTSTIANYNNARIIQNMFFVGPNGQPVQRYNPTDAFGWCCGDATAPGSGAYQTHGVSCLTPGVTLASRGLEANGIVYYLGWVPSLTQGTFIVLAFDLAQNPITQGGGNLTGNGYPMRPVGLLQTRSALSDPGGGLQTSTIVRSSTTGPNMWTGASNWYLGADNYATAYVSYVSSSLTDRLSLATGAIQTAPARGPQMTTWGNLTAIGGALPTVFDGQNAFEQGFPWSPDSAIATATAVTVGNGLDFSADTDTYTWIFTWEQFDAQGNLHISARSLPITITGQNLIDALGVSPSALKVGVSYTFSFIVPALGVTMRQWPQLTPGLGPPGNDLRSFCEPPSGLPSLGVYRTQKNESTFYRVYDRGFNGNDSGGDSFTLPALVDNTLASNLSNVPSSNSVGTVSMTDGLNDSVITRVNATSTLPFPLLYTDGTNGNPGSLDNYCPPASNIICRHKERLFIADGNLVMFTKQRGELQGPGYNTTVNSIYVGGDDAITGLASMDDKLIVFKQTQLYYITGDGPADDGTGSNFSDPQMIPTDAGCISAGSIIPTPEGIYFMSDAGLRLVTRSLSVEYVGGPVEDEFSTYPVVTGAVLYPSNNKVIFLANQSDVNGGLNILGEVIVRDYVLDAWTTTQYNNSNNYGFISTAVAYTNGSQGSWNSAPGYAWHTMDSLGQIYRENNPASPRAYWDGGNGLIVLNYVQSTWISAPIVMQDLSRFRAWDFQVWGTSLDPHQIVISTSIDYGPFGLTKTYPWSAISPTGSLPPISQIRSYDGRMGEAFAVQVQDVSDPASSTGQGFQVLGLSVTTGAYPGQYKLPPGSTQ